MAQNKFLPWIVIFNGVLLLLFVSAMGHCYRLVPEDYYAVWGNHQSGPWKQAVMVCNQWGGRFFSYLFSFVLLAMVENGFSYGWYFLAGNLVLIFSFFSIISYITNRYTLSFSAFEIFSMAVYAFICLFYLTPGIQESWFWVAASPSYYWGLVMAVAGTAFLFVKNIRWYQTLASSVCFLYACSASEPFSLLILFIFSAYLIRNLFAKTYLNIPLYFIPFGFALGGFMLMYFSKGTQDRWLAMPDLTIFVRLKRLAGAVVKYYMYYFPLKLLLAVCLTPFLFDIGNRLGLRKPIVIRHLVFRVGIIFILLYSGMLLLSFLPSCFVMGEAGPLRSWHHIGLYNAIFIFVFFIFLGYHFGKVIKINRYILPVWLVIITLTHGCFLFQQLQLSLTYAEMVEKRVALLKELKNRGFQGEYTLERLPESGFLFSAEIGTDKNDSRNKFLKLGMELPFDVKLVGN